MTLNYRAIVEMYPFPNEVIGSSIPVVKISLYLTEKETSQVGRKPRAHSLQGRQLTPPCIKRILEQGRTNGLKFTSDCLTLVIIYLLFKSPIIDQQTLKQLTIVKKKGSR